MDSQSIAYFSIPVGRYRFVVPGLAPYATLDRCQHGALGFRLVLSRQARHGIVDQTFSHRGRASLPIIMSTFPSAFSLLCPSFFLSN